MNYITDYQNFLVDAPLTAFNLKPSADGTVTFQNPKLANYGTVMIVVVDENSFVQTVKNIASTLSSDVRKRDLTLQKALDSNKGLIEQRQSKCLLKGASDFIEDVTSAQFMLIDDLDKVNRILAELGSNLAKGRYKKFNTFLPRWSSLSAEKKNFYYGEFQCHELNLWLKKNDRAYFDACCRVFLNSKMEKDFLDLYLLDDHAQILRIYGSEPIWLFGSLNEFELCLMCDVLARNGENEKARQIVKSRRAMLEAESEERSDEVQRLFDLILNMNSMSSG